MTKNSHRQTLTLEHDQNMDEFDQKYYIFSHVLMLWFVGVNFSVMFTKFGHIHLVILIGHVNIPLFKYYHSSLCKRLVPKLFHWASLIRYILGQKSYNLISFPDTSIIRHKMT